MDNKSCPSCGASSLDDRFSVSDGFCRECGFVLRSSNASVICQDDTKSDRRATKHSNHDWADSVKVRDSSEKTLVSLLSEIDSLEDELLLSSSELTQSAELLIEAWNENFLHGRESQMVIAAVLVVSLRQEGNPRPIGSIANAADVDKVKIQRIVKKLTIELDIHMLPPEPVDYLPFFGDLFGFESLVVDSTQDLLDSSESVPGCPANTAAAALYLAAKSCGASITYRQVGHLIGSTKETVWKRAQLLSNSQSL